MEAKTLVAMETHPISEAVAILTLLFQEQIVHSAKYVTGSGTLQKPIIKALIMLFRMRLPTLHKLPIPPLPSLTTRTDTLTLVKCTIS